MARKTSVPSQQLDRLKDLYNQQRDALVTLATAEEAVSAAQDTLAAAERGLKDAEAGVGSAYQALVALMGASATAQLTGRRANGKRAATTSRKERETNEQQPSTPAVSGAMR